MGSFDSQVSFGQYDIKFIGGDVVSLPVLFDIDITGVMFEFFAWPNVGATKIIDLDNSDLVIVAGDPDSVQNSISVDFDETDTAGWDFDCVQYRLRWDVGEGFKTLIIGNIIREA